MEGYINGGYISLTRLEARAWFLRALFYPPENAPDDLR